MLAARRRGDAIDDDSEAHARLRAVLGKTSAVNGPLIEMAFPGLEIKQIGGSLIEGRDPPLGRLLADVRRGELLAGFR